MSSAAASTEDCQNFLKQVQVPGPPKVYLLGCLERRVTVYSQQVRALNLIYALERCAGLQPGARIGIVGAGIAGLTAAAAALQRGFAVTLLEEQPGTVLLWRQADSDKRWLHPHVFDWPQQDSLQDDAKLPVMTWTANKARLVVSQLTSQWLAVQKHYPKPLLDERFSVSDVRVVDRRGKPELQWEPAGHGLECAAVILAVGFGEERTVEPLTKHSYWDDDDLSSPGTFAASKRCLISGSGDGGLTDVLRASIAGFQHDTFVKELGLDRSSSQAAEMVARLVEQVEAQAQRCSLDDRGDAEAAEILTKGYLSAEMTTCAAFIDEKLKERSTGRVVTLNHTGDDVLTRKASALNRLLVSRLIHLGRVKRWRGKLEDGAIQHQPGNPYQVTIKGQRKEFDKVIIRQGVSSALQKLEPEWAQKCEAALGSFSMLDLTRKQLWPDGWLRDDSGSTSSAAGGGSGGGAGSVLQTTLEATQAAPMSPYVGIPRAAKRDQLVGQQGVVEEIRAKLQSGHRACIGQAVVIPGAGGLGKTQLAVEYVDRYGATYPGGVIWLQADGQLDMQLLVLAQDAGWFPAGTDSKQLLDLARQRLRSRPDCLLVFDNLEQLADIKDYLPPSTASTHILATSRNIQEAFTPIELKLLAEEPARQLLIQEAGRLPQSPAEQQAAQDIADRLAGLPLALELAGRKLRHLCGLTFAGYRTLLQNKGLAELPQVLSATAALQQSSIIAVLQVSEQVFAESPLLRQVIDVLTYSGVSAVGQSLLAAVLGVTWDDLTVPLALGDTLKLLELEASSRPGERTRPRIHRLVSEARRHYVKATDLNPGAAALCDRLADWFASRRKDFAQLAAFEAELEALRTWQQYASANRLPQEVRLLWLQAYPHYHHGQYAQAREWLTQALTRAADYTQLPQTQLADLHSDLGSCCDEEGQYDKALTHGLEALKVRQQCLAPDHPDVATSLNNIGATYYAQGNYPEALKHHKQALDIRTNRLSVDHPDVAASMNNIGQTYLAQGNYPEALKHHKQALDIRTNRLGADHPHVAASLNSIGGTYYAQGNYPEALKHEKQALDIRTNRLGADHPDVATSLNSIGGTYLAQGNYPEALKHQKQALDIRTNRLGADHPHVAASLNSIGGTYLAQGNYPEALKHQKQALDIRTNRLGADHPHVAASLNSIGGTYLAQGNYPEALKHEKQALDIRTNRLGADHPDVATSLNSIGGTYLAQGNYPEALKHQKQALDIRTNRLGADHPTTGTCHVNLGLTYLMLKDEASGWTQLQQGYKILLARLGAGHPETIGTVKGMLRLGPHHSGQLIAQHCLAQLLAQLPLEHPQRAELEALQGGSAGAKPQSPQGGRSGAPKAAAKSRKKKG